MSLTAVLGLICFLILTMFTYVTYADESSQTFIITNYSPVIETINTSNNSLGDDQSSVTPAEGSDFIVYIHGSASDENGCEDINDVSQWALRLYRSGVIGSFSCSGDDSNCYNPSSESTLALTGCDGSTDTDITYQWTVTLKHFIEPTDASASNYSNNDWKARVVVADTGLSSDSIIDSFEVATLRALTVSSMIDYGSLAPGSSSAQQAVDVTNTGNDDMDFYVRTSGPMVCDTGSIPSESIHYSLSDGFDYNSAGQLGESDVPVDATVSRRTNLISKRPLHFILKVPLGGATGHCTSTVTFTAKANE